jgi:cytochrome P450
MEQSSVLTSPAARSAVLREIADLPGPRGLPLLGNLMQVDRTRVHASVEQWSREYGPFFPFRLGRRQFLVVADHDALGVLLRDRPDGFRRTSRLSEIWNEMGLPSGVFGAEGDTWLRQRRMVMAGFDPKHVKDYFPSLLKVTQRLRGRWQKAARAGQSVDLQADLMRFTVDAIAGLAFGAEVNTLESDQEVIQRHLDKIFPTMFKRILSPFPLWRYIKLPADRALDRSVIAVNAAIEGFVAQARERMRQDPALHTTPRNLLEAMIAAADRGDADATAQASTGLPATGGRPLGRRMGAQITDRDVAGNVLTMLLAGEDTTANTLAWMIDLLQRNPHSLEQAQQEVRRVAADSAAFTPEQMARLDFVEACAHETMRLKPVAPFFALQALRDSVIADIRVPAGTLIWCALRRDSLEAQHFPEPLRFDPQRWLGEPGQASHSASSGKRISMPFGAGPRVCPGRYLALLEMKMALAMLLAHFDIMAVDTPDGGEPRENLAFTMAPVGLKMRLRERL